MKQITTRILIILFAAILFNGCNKENETVTPQAKQQSSNLLTAQQEADLLAKADKIANAAANELKSGANMRAVGPDDLIGFNVNSVSATGPSAATYSFTAYIQNIGSLSPGQQTTHNYVFCAAANHFRYAVFYLYNGYIHNMVNKGSLYGSTGGCLSGSLNFTENFGGPNTSQMYVVVFDVLNGPGGGATQFASMWSNQRDLFYPGLSVYGHYWE